MDRRLRLLWVTPYLPRRGFSAAREYWWALLARLAPRHVITLLAFVDPEDLGVAGVLPTGLAAVHQVPKMTWRPDDPLAVLPRTVAGGFSNPAFASAIAARLATDRYDLVQYEFIEMANLIPPPVSPTILTVHQIGFADEGPMWRVQGRRLRRGAVLLHRYLRELDFELRAVRRVHHVITLSHEDAARLLRFHPDLRVSVSPVGVDCRYFSPLKEPVKPEIDLVFVGAFEHPPNPDAVCFLIREVVPRLNRRVRVRVVGRGVTTEVAALARAGAVEIMGPVADVRPHLACAAVVVAPVRFGTGMRGKVLEALAMGRPVVTTSVGAEGLGAESGRHLIVADGAEDFAAAVRRVLADSSLAGRLGAEGRSLAEARFNWDRIAAAYEGIYEEILRNPGPSPMWDGDSGFPKARAVARLGRWPGIATGATVLMLRAFGWHLARIRQRKPVTSRGRLSATNADTVT